MKVFDDKFKTNKSQYILQSMLATSTIIVVLIILDIITDAIIIASFGASSFIAFLMPHLRVSKGRFMIGGYLVGILSGSFCNLISSLHLLNNIPFLNNYLDIILGALSVGIAMFVMTITNTEHPPAAGLALGITFDFSFTIVLVSFLGIILIWGAKTLLKKFLIDLV